MAARWAGQTRRAAGARPQHAPFYQVGAVDDRGVSYQAALWDMGVEDGRDWWDCHLSLDPAPPPGTRWLEVGPGAQGQRVRIDLAAPPGTVRVVTEPVPPASAATRLLDQAGDDLLGLESAGTGTSAQLEGRVRQVIRDLIGSGTLRADDPAVLRLSGLGWRLGLDLGSGGPVPARALPPAWISLLADGHAHDGPEAVAPFAADLPAIGGARFALAGLRSAAGGATLHVMASGWEPAGHRWLVRGTGPAGRPVDLSLSWRARDSTGRWHLVTGMVWGSAAQTRGMIKMYLTPPLHPAATGPRRDRHRARPPGPRDRAARLGRGRPAPRPADPAGDGAGPVSSPWWAAFPPAEARIRCGAGEHLLRWADGRLSSAAHDDTEGELVLAALGGDKAECVAMLEAWGAHADDLDVLALGPRSPADELVVTWELVDQLRASFGPSPRSVPMRPGPAPAAYTGAPSGSGCRGRPAAQGAADPGHARPDGCLPSRSGPAPGARNCCPCSPWARTSSSGWPPRWHRPGPPTRLQGFPASWAAHARRWPPR